MEDKKLKIFVAIAVLFLAIAIIAFYSNQFVAFIISAVANAIQIILFIYWYFQKNPLTEKAVTQIGEVHEEVVKAKEKTAKKVAIVRKLIEIGSISESEIKKILNQLRNKEIILIHTYGESIPKTIRNLLPDKDLPLISVIRKLGFVRVFGQHNLFIVFKNNLPKNLRKLDNLEKMIMDELEPKWEEISKTTKQKFPQKNYKVFEKWRNMQGFKCSYLIAKALEEEVKIGFKGRYSFAPEFIDSMVQETKPKELKKTLPKEAKLRKFISKISIDILVSELSTTTRKKIKQNEATIRKELGIKYFTDFHKIGQDKVLTEIKKHIQDKPEELTHTLISESKGYYDNLIELGLRLDA